MIKQAIIPLAGQGTRLLPLTSVFAKELLPMNGKPGIEYIIEECIDAGIKEIVFIISKKKEMIKDYFYKDKFYQNIIKKKKDKRIKIINNKNSEGELNMKFYWKISILIIPFLIACFSIPELSDSARVAYCYFTYIVHGMVFYSCRPFL